MKCPLCGFAHRPSERCGHDTVTENVTATRVTPMRVTLAVTDKQDKRDCPNCRRLEAEIERLKQRLAPPASAAERARRYRAKRKSASPN
jgi:hypothetical protein